MKRCLVPLFVALALLSGACASVPLKQKAVQTLQANEVILGQAQDLERQLCDPEKAALAPAVPIGACVGSTAATIGLTDARHRDFLKAIIPALQLQKTLAPALQQWRAGTPPPATLAELKADLEATLKVVAQLAPGNAKVQTLSGKVQLALDGVIKVIADVTAAKK